MRKNTHILSSLALTHKFLAFPALLQPLRSDDVLNDRDGRQELDCARHFAGHQMSALLRALRHFTTELVQSLKQTEDMCVRVCVIMRARGSSQIIY